MPTFITVIHLIEFQINIVCLSSWCQLVLFFLLFSHNTNGSIDFTWKSSSSWTGQWRKIVPLRGASMRDMSLFLDFEWIILFLSESVVLISSSESASSQVAVVVVVLDILMLRRPWCPPLLLIRSEFEIFIYLFVFSCWWCYVQRIRHPVYIYKVYIPCWLLTLLLWLLPSTEGRKRARTSIIRIADAVSRNDGRRRDPDVQFLQCNLVIITGGHILIARIDPDDEQCQ